MQEATTTTTSLYEEGASNGVAHFCKSGGRLTKKFTILRLSCDVLVMFFGYSILNRDVTLNHSPNGNASSCP